MKIARSTFHTLATACLALSFVYLNVDATCGGGGGGGLGGATM